MDSLAAAAGYKWQSVWPPPCEQDLVLAFTALAERHTPLVTRRGFAPAITVVYGWVGGALPSLVSNEHAIFLEPDACQPWTLETLLAETRAEVASVRDTLYVASHVTSRSRPQANIYQTGYQPALLCAGDVGVPLRLTLLAALCDHPLLPSDDGLRCPWILAENLRTQLVLGYYTNAEMQQLLSYLVLYLQRYLGAVTQAARAGHLSDVAAQLAAMQQPTVLQAAQLAVNRLAGVIAGIRAHDTAEGTFKTPELAATPSPAVLLDLLCADMELAELRGTETRAQAWQGARSRLLRLLDSKQVGRAEKAVQIITVRSPSSRRKTRPVRYSPLPW